MSQQLLLRSNTSLEINRIRNGSHDLWLLEPRLLGNPHLILGLCPFQVFTRLKSSMRSPMKNE
jgi:hypothetical protein